MLNGFARNTVYPYCIKLLSGVWTLAVFGAFLVVGIHGVEAAQPQTNSSNVIIIGNDNGGSVSERARQILRIRSTGQRVEIRGRKCLSSCTMYLGLENVCVSPNTVFGFHGPSRHGRPLEASEFERWSQVIADHYPKNLQAWYMSTGRNQLFRYSRIKGRELIRLGLSACQ